MLDFRKQFQEIIEQSYIPFNIDKAATSDVWSNIYKLILPNIPEKLFRYRKIDDKGYTIESLKSWQKCQQSASDTEDNSPISEYGKPFDICTYIIRLSFIENPNGSTVCNYDSAS